MLRYTEEHEWLRLDGDEVTVGITEHAAEQLGDIVFIELPEEGTTVAKGDDVVTIESVKAASDISAPLDGQITEVNAAVVERRRDVAGGLHRLDRDDLVALGDGRPFLGQLDEDDVAELLGGVLGDPDRDLVAVEPQPLVLLGVS